MRYFKLLILVLGTLLLGCNEIEPQDNGLKTTDDEIVSIEETPDWDITRSLDLTTEEIEKAKNLTIFSDKLIDNLGERGESFSISPLSINLYLAMLANSCAPDQREAILWLLGCEDIEVLNSIASKYLHYLPSDAIGAKIQVANRVWTADYLSIPNDYHNRMAEIFNAQVVPTDFASSSAYEMINTWVSENTNGIIKYIVDSSLPSSTAMLMANTFYFHGKWSSEFDPSLTTTEPFAIKLGESTDVEMMHKSYCLQYSKNELGEYVQIPMNGENNLEIYLPSEGMTPALSTSERLALRNSSATYDCTLGLPKFTIEEKIEIGELLGISSLNLSPIGIFTPQTTNVLHQVGVKVDEHGAEMAAVTGGWVTATPDEEMEFPKVKLTINRPFMYIFRNANDILMAGIVYNP